MDSLWGGAAGHADRPVRQSHSRHAGHVAHLCRRTGASTFLWRQRRDGLDLADRAWFPDAALVPDRLRGLAAGGQKIRGLMAGCARGICRDHRRTGHLPAAWVDHRTVRRGDGF